MSADPLEPWRRVVARQICPRVLGREAVVVGFRNPDQMTKIRNRELSPATCDHAASLSRKEAIRVNDFTAASKAYRIKNARHARNGNAAMNASVKK